jgi:hypothetical protein
LSTTDATAEATADRGQVLVIFALTLTVLILFAALAFDTGMMLVQRRDQQNAADAAAIAGAYFLPGNTADARSAAEGIADANDFVDGGNVDVTINIPPVAGDHIGQAGAIEVVIDDNRPSIFGGILGVAGWDISARAVAVNQDGVGAGFAMLALEEHDCDAIFVSGNGSVTANGNIQVNSDCTSGALRRQAGGTITVTAPDSACNVHGDIQDGGGTGNLNCTQNEGAPIVPDPLEGLAAPDKPAYPADVVQVSGTEPIPNGCPGAIAPDLESTEDAPITCQFTSSYMGTTWRLYPGYYPGGIHLQAGTFYWEPGIYWIGGGGVQINGIGTTSISVASGGTALDYGIMIYNTEDPAFHTECAAGTATDPGVQCLNQIILNGSTASIDFYSLNNGSIYDGLVIFQDRDLDYPGEDVIIDGSTSNTEIRGTMYVPSGDIRVNGSGGTMTTDQVIANTFTVNGAPGSSINVLFDEDFIFKFTAAGLVE